jgi:alpha-1,3-rhamnosyl/mannosyltransferase
VAASAQRADLIQVPSADTRRALLERWPAIAPERVRVTPFGVAREFRPTAAGEDLAMQRRRLGLPDRYVLFVGTIEPRKGLRTLLEAWRRLALDDRALVVAGRPGWGCAEELRALAELERQGRARRLGFVPRAELPGLYRAADLFVYPSLYEGFGFPPLEAMASGVPVISSQGSAFDDNLAGAAELVPASDAGALAASIRALLGESVEERRRRIERGLARAGEFRWRRTAELVFECYRELAPAARPASRSGR